MKSFLLDSRLTLMLRQSSEFSIRIWKTPEILRPLCRKNSNVWWLEDCYEGTGYFWLITARCSLFILPETIRKPRFSDVFRGYEKRTPSSNVLNPKIPGIPVIRSHSLIIRTSPNPAYNYSVYHLSAIRDGRITLVMKSPENKLPHLYF